MKSGRQEEGFTLVEVLVAIALFGILLTVLIPGITALLGVSRKSEQQLGSATVAQRVLEDVKGAWQTQDAFDRNCVPNLSLPDTDTTAKSQTLNSRAGGSGTPVDIVKTASCPTLASSSPALVSGQPPAMRRVTVSSGTGAQATTLTLDVLRPQ